MLGHKSPSSQAFLPDGFTQNIKPSRITRDHRVRASQSHIEMIEMLKSHKGWIWKLVPSVTDLKEERRQSVELQALERRLQIFPRINVYFSRPVGRDSAARGEDLLVMSNIPVSTLLDLGNVIHAHDKSKEAHRSEHVNQVQARSAQS